MLRPAYPSPGNAREWPGQRVVNSRRTPAVVAPQRIRAATLQPAPQIPGDGAIFVGTNVPGPAGPSCMKWLTHRTVQEDAADGYYAQTAYRMPVNPVHPGAIIRRSEMIPVTEMAVKSIIARPLEGAKVPGGTVQVEGVAL